MGFWSRLIGGSPKEQMTKALDAPKKPVIPQSYEFDPTQFAMGNLSDEHMSEDFYVRGSGLSYTVLQNMARTPVIAAIINTRVNQVAEFAIPQPDPYSLGYQIRLRDHEKEMTPVAKRKAQEIAQWLQTCGDERVTQNLTFESFLRMITRDSLIYDQATFEVVKTRGGKPSAIIPVDASTIRRATLTEGEIETGRRSIKRNGYVQIVNKKKVVSFEQDEIGFGIRRPRSWIKANGYGFPELEELIRVVTSILNADMHKANDYSVGLSTAGILAVKSKMNPQLFRSFRREFYSMLSGAQNSRRTPIIQLDPEANEELQSIDLKSNKNWQDYQQWTSYLLKISCAMFQMDASELGFVFGAEGQVNSLSSSNPETRIIASKEKGLRPLLRAQQSWLNKWVIHKIDPDFEIKFGGLSAKSESEKLEQELKRVKHYMTINEVRAHWDLEPLDSKVANMILDPTYIGSAQMEEAEKAEAEAQEQEGKSFDSEDFDIDEFLGIEGDDILASGNETLREDDSSTRELGWEPIPGGKKGGRRRRLGDKWEYDYSIKKERAPKKKEPAKREPKAVIPQEGEKGAIKKGGFRTVKVEVL